jgi:pentatricopeptide repeat protein
VLKSMSGAHSRHKPDLKTYNIIMSNYAQAGEVEKMEWSLSRMEAANFQPNLRSHEILMTGYGGAGAFAKMCECCDLMLEAGIQPQLSTLNVMLGAYCKHNSFEEAEELLSNASEWQIRQRTSSYLILLR